MAPDISCSDTLPPNCEKFRPRVRQIFGDTTDQKRITDVASIPGGFLATGFTEDSAGFSKPYFLRIDEAGSVIGERRIELSDSLPRRPSHMLTFDDGSGALAGSSGTYGMSQPWAARFTIMHAGVASFNMPRIVEIDLR